MKDSVQVTFKYWDYDKTTSTSMNSLQFIGEENW
jgi:hypothetical protein